MYTSEEVQEILRLSQRGVTLRSDERRLQEDLARMQRMIISSDEELDAYLSKLNANKVIPASDLPESETELPITVPVPTGPKTFGTTRRLINMVRDAATRDELPPLDYPGGAPSTLEEGMEFLLGTQWEMQTIRYKGKEQLAVDVGIQAWLQEAIPHTVELLSYVWNNNHPAGLQPDTHLAAAAKRVPVPMRQYVLRLAEAMRFKAADERISVASEDELRDNDTRLSEVAMADKVFNPEELDREIEQHDPRVTQVPENLD